MKDRSDNPSHHEQTLLPWSYISLLIIFEVKYYHRPLYLWATLQIILKDQWFWMIGAIYIWIKYKYAYASSSICCYITKWGMDFCGSRCIYTFTVERRMSKITLLLLFWVFFGIVLNECPLKKCEVQFEIFHSHF